MFLCKECMKNTIENYFTNFRRAQLLGLVLSILFIAVLSVFAGSCSSAVPYFEMSALNSYSADAVYIPYSFSAETDTHEAECVLEVLVVPENGNSYYTVEDEFTRMLPREGALQLPISEAGFYRFTVTLLSSRGTLRRELSFLTDTVMFEVVP